MPAEPEVVGIDYERQLPANKSIYVGESAGFLLVFDPVEFICNENDFTTSDDDVTVTMEEGADNVVRIALGEDITPGYVVAVYFRDQLIMFVTAAEKVVIERATVPAGSVSLPMHYQGLEVSELIDSDYAVINFSNSDESHDVRLDKVGADEYSTVNPDNVFGLGYMSLVLNPFESTISLDCADDYEGSSNLVITVVSLRINGVTYVNSVV